MLFLFFLPAPFVVHFFIFPTTHYIHDRDTFSIQKFHSSFHLLSQKIGTFGRAGRRDILFFVVCCNSNRTSVKQCSHRNSFSFSKHRYISGQASNTFPIPKKQNKTLSWRHNQETLLFLWGQCSASCAKINMASRRAILNSWGAPALVFYWILQMAFAHWAVRCQSLAACAS